MAIRAGHQNKEIIAAAQYSLNTIKTIRHGIENCNGNYEAKRKEHSRRSDCVRKAEFIKNLKKKGLENSGIGIRALERKLNASLSTI